jgi:integrase
MAKALTVKAIDAMKPGPTRQEVPDGGLPGLYFVVQPSGTTSWAVRYRADGKPRKMTIGAYPLFGLAQARDAAREALQAVAKGRDPGAEKIEAKAAPAVEVDNVEKVFDEFVTRHVRAKNKAQTADNVARIIEREIKPAWKGRSIQAITRRDVRTMLDGMVDRGAPYMANRTHALLRKFFNWAIERDIVQTSPIANTSAPADEESRDRVLSDDEIKLVWHAAKAIGWPFGPMTQLLLLTGQRRDEVASATWAEFDLDAEQPTWTIPKERAKNGTAHTVALAPAAIEILKALPRIKDSKGNARFILTTTGETPISGYSRGKSALDTKMLELAKKDAIEAGDDPDKVELVPWRFHDLRRTAASGMAGLGIPPHVVEKLLNHRSGTIKGVAAVYNRHDYGNERRQALQAWASRVAAIIADKNTSNVVTLHGRG